MGRLFFMPVETVPRDLEYKYFLCREIYDEGDLFVIARPWILQTLCNIFSGINWIGQNCFEISKFTKESVKSNLDKKKGMLFYFDEEGGVYPIERGEEIFLNRFFNTSLDQNDKIYVWGRKQFNLASDLGLNPTLVGHPRFRKKKNSKISKKKSSKDILVLTNMSLLMTNRDFSYQFASKEIPEERLYKESLKNFEKLLNFIGQNKEKILIRIHPSEDRNLYINFFRNFKNVEILPRESLEDSFSRSNNIFHFNCTTALDAYCHGIEVTNLADGNFTILSDINNNEFSSEWLHFPCDMEKILKDIKKFAKQKSNITYIKYFIYFLCLSLEIVYKIREFLKSNNYQNEKFGKFFGFLNPRKVFPIELIHDSNFKNKDESVN